MWWICVCVCACAVSYGIRLAIALTKLVIERGYKPFVVIRPENDASRNLYTKLGFTKAYETCRVKLMPYVHATTSPQSESTTANGSCALLYEPSAPEADEDQTEEKTPSAEEPENIENAFDLKCSLRQKSEDEVEVEQEPATPTTIMGVDGEDDGN